MAKDRSAELRMNLAAVKRADPYAKEIVEQSAHVAFYTFNYEENEWEKTDVEGAFFIYKRTAEPFHSIFINNRLNTNSLVEPITTDLEIQAQPPFLLYRNERSRIRGFWFYNKDELQKVADLISNLVKEKNNRSNNHGNSILQGQQPTLTHQLANMMDISGQALHHPPNDKSTSSQTVNIFSMLSKAQEDFNNSQTTSAKAVPVEPKLAVVKNGSNAAISNSGDGGAPDGAVIMRMAGQSTIVGSLENQMTSQSVMNFFASAAKPSMQRQQQPAQAVHHSSSNGTKLKAADNINGNKSQTTAQPPLLQRLMSNPPLHTVEQIEKQQRTVTPHESVGGGGGRTNDTLIWSQGNVSMPAMSNESQSLGANNQSWTALFGQKATMEPSASISGDLGLFKMLKEAETTGGPVTMNNNSSSHQKPALMPPTMFLKRDMTPANTSMKAAAAAATTGKPLQGREVKPDGKIALDLQIKPEPLTQSQLLQAVSYLIKNDPDFMRKLHEAYLKSFAEIVSL